MISTEEVDGSPGRPTRLLAIGTDGSTLERDDRTVTAAATAADALDSLADHDVVVVDHEPPDRDAFSVLEAVRTADADRPVIVLADEPAIAERAFEAGAADVRRSADALPAAVLDHAVSTVFEGRDDADGRARTDRRIDEQVAVLRETHGILSDRDLSFEERLDALLAVGRNVLDTDYATLSRVDGDDYVFEAVDAPEDTIREGDVVPLSATNCERTIETERMLVLEDVATDAPELTDRAGYAEWGIACYLGVPVFVDGDLYGTFCFYDDSPRETPFSEWQLTLVDLWGQWVSYALERIENERELRRRRDRLETLVRLDEVVRDVSHAIIEADSREALESAVCERLADRYRFAWIGGVARGANDVTPRTAAGVDEGYLAEIDISIDGEDPTGRGPTARAVRSREPQFQSNVLESPEYEPWREAARERGYRSSAAIPIQYDGALYGVLNVYSADSDAFETSERELLSHLGGIVGHAICAVERRKALVSDTATEIELRMEGVGRSLLATAIDGDGTVSLERTVPTGDGSMLRFVSVSGVDPDRFRKAVEGYSWVDGASLVAERDDESLFELVTTDSPVSGLLASYGGRIRAATITVDGLRLIAELPPDVGVRAVIERIEDAYPGTELLAQRTVTREGTNRQELHGVLTDALTDKQRAALETAYLAGYFDWPRTNSGEEVADLLGCSPATFAQHLRIAERKLFDALFSE